MSENEEPKITFAKLSPFESTVSDHSSMYDNLPYQRNQDVCNGSKVAKESGNVLKFYRCSVKGSYEVSNQDESTSKMLAKLRHQQSQTVPYETVSIEEAPPSGGITEEQMDELFRDSEEE